MNSNEKTHSLRSVLADALKAAWPIMAGYVVLGLPAGILCNAAGMAPWMTFVLSLVLYSGAGQYMIGNMILAGNPLVSIFLSVSLVNTRQMLYSASLSRFVENSSLPAVINFAGTVTDESFGVNLALLEAGAFDVPRATAVNFFSMFTWATSNMVGCALANAISLPTALASFAMTSLFLCLLCLQKFTQPNVIAMIGALVGVIVCKILGLGGVCIFLGAIIGIACAMFATRGQKGAPQEVSAE